MDRRYFLTGAGSSLAALAAACTSKSGANPGRSIGDPINEIATTSTEAPPTTLPPTTTTAPPTTVATTVPPVLSGISPLTGTPVTGDTPSRPVVAVKIDNTASGRPQTGVAGADVVYEIQVEGQVTRLLALFQSTESTPVGPIRSARESEVALLEELGRPIFAWHGANKVLSPHVRASNVVPASIDDVPRLYYRSTDRKAPFNSYITSTVDLRQLQGAGAPPPIFVFGENTSPHAQPAKIIQIGFPAPFGRGGGEQIVVYEWDGSVWQRWAGGTPHVDSQGVRVSATNVIVRITPAIDSGTVDRAGTKVPTAATVGRGDAWIFTQNKAVIGFWDKPSATERCRYLDPDGNEVPLSPGKTWIIMPYGTTSQSGFG